MKVRMLAKFKTPRENLTGIYRIENEVSTIRLLHLRWRSTIDILHTFSNCLFVSICYWLVLSTTHFSKRCVSGVQSQGNPRDWATPHSRGAVLLIEVMLEACMCQFDLLLCQFKCAAVSPNRLKAGTSRQALSSYESTKRQYYEINIERT